MVASAAGWCVNFSKARRFHHAGRRVHTQHLSTPDMKTLQLSVILALATAVFGASSLSAQSPRAAANAPAKSAKGHCDSKGGSCCKKDCKK